MAPHRHACVQKNTRRRGAPRKVLVKLQTLRRLVPGGHRLRRPDQLILQTADYIMQLKLQVNVLEAILKLHEP